MEERTNEQTLEITPTVAEAKDENGGEEKVSLGKFKDTEALLKAYNSLSAEFTKRCQKIKELEATISDKTEKVPEESAKPEIKPEGAIPDKTEILKEYLKEILGSKSDAIVMDGSGASLKTPPAKPKTIAEAGKLAKDFLNK